MGEAKRHRDNAAWETAIHSAEAEGQGTWSLDIVFPRNLPELVRDIRCHDAHAGRLLGALLQAATGIPAQEPPALCLLCDHEFRDDGSIAAFVVVLPKVDSSGHAIVNGLCDACAEADRLLERVLASYRKTMMPGLRVIPEPGGEGHA